MRRAAGLAVVLLACGPQRRGEPIAGPLSLTEEEQRGRVVFMARCNSCHPGGEAGLGPTVTGAPTPVWLQRQQVRLGAGAMPAFGKDEISSEDLDAVAAFLRALKHHEPPREAVRPPAARRTEENPR